MLNTCFCSLALFTASRGYTYYSCNGDGFHKQLVTSLPLHDGSIWEKLRTYSEFISFSTHTNAVFSYSVIRVLQGIFVNTLWIQSIGTLSFSALPITLAAFSILGTAQQVSWIFFCTYWCTKNWSPKFFEKTNNAFYTNTIFGNILLFNYINYSNFFWNFFSLLKPTQNETDKVRNALQENQVWLFLPLWDCLEHTEYGNKVRLAQDIFDAYAFSILHPDSLRSQSRADALIATHPNLKGPILFLRRVGKALHDDPNSDLSVVISEYKETAEYTGHNRAFLAIQQKYLGRSA